MAPDKKNITLERGGVTIQVNPIDSPSENTLVSEHLQRMPSIFSRGLIYLILLLLAVATAYSLWGRMDIVAECPAVARPLSDLIKVVADRSGYIDRIYVSEGQEITQDMPLFLIRSRESMERSQEVNRLKLEQNRATIASIDSELEFWRKEVARLSKDVKDLEDLLKSGIVSRKDVEDTRSNLNKAETEVSKLQSRRNITANESRILEQQMAERVEESEKLITAESAGTLAELFFKNTGEYIQGSELLCTIVPEDSPIFMDITVANRDIGFIQEQMSVKYKFEAFPSTDYGILKGSVSAIPPAAVENEQIGFVYQVQGPLEKPFFEIEGKAYPIKTGMTATAEIVTENKTIFAILFRRIKGSK
jgi:multidrug resistance efflux pump